jgi:hypothetical protein
MGAPSWAFYLLMRQKDVGHRLSCRARTQCVELHAPSADNISQPLAQRLKKR